jgi:hypothetical protein
MILSFSDIMPDLELSARLLAGRAFESHLPFHRGDVCFLEIASFEQPGNSCPLTAAATMPRRRLLENAAKLLR